MHDRTRAISAEELLSHMGWVRTLARSLVRDPNVADDVAQEALLAAVERPPRQAASLRAWLSAVTRTQARQSARSEGRRRRREHEAARAREESDSAHGILERGALQQHLVQSIMALDEPYRSSVLYRYLDGLDSKRIARLQGVSPAAVRKRLSRGIELLRGRLEREHGGDARHSLLALLAQAPARATIDATGGLLAVGTFGKLSAACAAIGLGAWLWVSNPRSPVGPAGAPAAPLVQEARPDDVARPEDDREGERESAALASVPEQLGSATSSAPEHAAFVARARVIGPDGEPVPGAELQLLGLEAQPADGRGRVVAHCPGEAVADCFEASRRALAEGSFVSQEHEGWLTWVASAPGYTRSTLFEDLPKGDSLELGTIELFPLGSVAGRVVDRSGRGVPNARVCAVIPSMNVHNRVRMRLWGPGHQKRVRSVDTDARGTFTFGALPEGVWRIWAGGGAHVWSHSEVFRLGDGAPVPELLLVVDEVPLENRISGRVLRPDGSAAAAAEIELMEAGVDGGMVYPAGACDDAGAFLVTVEANTVWSLRAVDRKGSGCAQAVDDVPAGSTGLVVRLDEPSWLDVTVRDAEGATLLDFDLRVVREGERFPFVYERVRHAAQGQARVAVPGAPVLLTVTSPGFADAELGPLAAQPGSNAVDVRLEKLAIVRGRVRAGGAPLEGAVVQLVQVGGRRSIDYLYGFPARLDGSNLVGVYSGSDGMFELPITKPATYSLYAEHDEWAAVELGPLELDPTRDELIEIELTQGGAIEGRVLTDPGEDAAGITVKASRGDMRVHEARTDSRGRYRIEGLTPGPWMVRASTLRSGARVAVFASAVETRDFDEDFVFPWDCQVAEGQTTYIDLDLSEQDVGSLEGSLTIEGAPYGNASVRLHSTENAWSYELHDSTLEAVGSDGTFHFGEMRTGDYWLVVTGGGGVLESWQWIERVEVREGVNAHPITFDLASLEVRGSRSDRALALVVRAPSGSALMDLALAPAGVFSVPLPSRGHVELVERGDASRHADPLEWSAVQRVEAAPGASLVLEIPD